MTRAQRLSCMGRVGMIAGVILFVVSGARANEANYQQYIIGDRASGMGGAVCAIAEAIDACYNNPAGLAQMRNNSVSLSASLYGFDRYGADDALYPNENLRTDSFLTIPSCMGTVFNMGTNATVAFAVLVPNKNSISEIVGLWDEQHFYNFYIDDQTLWAGPSLGYQLLPELSIGASIFGVYRTYSCFENVYIGNYDYSEAYNLKYSNVGLLSLLGAQYRPDDRWNFGMTFQTPSMNLWGDGKFETHEALAQDLYQDSSVNYAEDMDSDNHIPAKITAGVGWQKPKNYAFEADVSYHLPTSFTRLEGVFETGDEAIVNVRRESVVDTNIGAEYYILGTYPVRGGFFTSLSSAPDLDVTETGSPAQIDLYGLTTSVGVEKERVTMNLGLSYAFGYGKDFGWSTSDDDELDVTIVEAKENHLFLFLTTSYLF